MDVWYYTAEQAWKACSEKLCSYDVEVMNQTETHKTCSQWGWLQRHCFCGGAHAALLQQRGLSKIKLFMLLCLLGRAAAAPSLPASVKTLIWSWRTLQRLGLIYKNVVSPTSSCFRCFPQCWLNMVRSEAYKLQPVLFLISPIFKTLCCSFFSSVFFGRCSLPFMPSSHILLFLFLRLPVMHQICFYIKFRVRTNLCFQIWRWFGFFTVCDTVCLYTPRTFTQSSQYMGIHSSLQCGHSWRPDKLDNKFTQ